MGPAQQQAVCTQGLPLTCTMPTLPRSPGLVLQVRVVVGEPVKVDDLLRRAREQGWEEDMLHRSIAERVGQRLVSMHDQLLGRQSSAVVGAGNGVFSSPGPTPNPGLGQCGLSCWEQISFNLWHRTWCLAAASASAPQNPRVASFP